MIKPKQMGDAGEMLVAAQLTLHGIPAYTVPANWPAYDVAADLPDGSRQAISVKTRTGKKGNGLDYADADQFDWLAVVILDDEVAAGPIVPRFLIVPRKIADARAVATNGRRGWLVSSLVKPPPSPFPGPVPKGIGGWGLADFENNFTLSSPAV